MDIQAFLEMDEITKYERFVELERIAYTDRLTGCKNRNYLLDNRQSIETDDSCAVIIDIDHFKKVNDTLGHAAGDEVLKDVAKVIMSVVRNSDTIRYGGEEFVIFLQNSSIERAVLIAERIRKAIQSGTTVTASIGVSTDLTSADKALYEAKETGRNKVVAA
jgi:diguanylate cyclase (GGDEF)-like protein